MAAVPYTDNSRGPAFQYDLAPLQRGEFLTKAQIDTATGRAAEAASIPTAGSYVRGQFVWNTVPAISGGKVLLGWSRLTTGSAHVANTDWAACYVTNS
ncbi:hypothetical protein Kuura_012 [Caulobacter phage Kuura]|nr:hypothetical protein Kuura_012 [Caulobacter phage Kuura]